MRHPEEIGSRRLTKPVWRMLVVALLVALIAVGAAMASSGGGHGEEGGSHGATATKGWVATDTYRVMNFAVLAIALIFLLRKPLTNALNGRIEGIRSQLADLEAKKEQAERQLAETAGKLANLEQEAERIKEQYIRQAEDARARIIEEAKASARKLEDMARRNIDREFELARLNLQRDVLEKALEKAEEMLKTGITGVDQDRLVDDYLTKVVA